MCKGYIGRPTRQFKSIKQGRAAVKITACTRGSGHSLASDVSLLLRGGVDARTVLRATARANMCVCMCCVFVLNARVCTLSTGCSMRTRWCFALSSVCTRDAHLSAPWRSLAVGSWFARSRPQDTCVRVKTSSGWGTTRVRTCRRPGGPSQWGRASPRRCPGGSQRGGHQGRTQPA